MKPSQVNLALTGKTVCIVGLGPIGHLLADRLRAFGMHLVATDDRPGNAPSDIKRVSARQTHFGTGNPF